ncbi:MAG: AAA family ATPase [Dehalococcoidia bacterium]|nr:AAA family ATPase [Dehalococcoidia bacterium]
MLELLSQLNPAQQEAVRHTDGPLLILAGPGSGKTRVIAHRVAYLVEELGISPYRIMAVTFTNKAAREMKDRVEELLGQAAEGMTIGTFHSICARILRLDGDRIGIDKSFVIYDGDDQRSLIKRSIQELGIDPRRTSPGAVLGAISNAKSQLITSERYLADHNHSYFDEIVYRCYSRYTDLLRESKALDFDDLIMKTDELFRDVPDVLEKYRSRYLHLLIDEFQDTNHAQYVYARQLAGIHNNICVVGDPDQSIYSWRSADIRNILDFEHDFPDAKVVYLEQNYRSSKTILEAANKVITANKRRKDRKLWTENEAGAPLVIKEAFDQDEEARFVCTELLRLERAEGIRLGDCAVMYRTNAQSRALEETMVRQGMPYRLVGATRFYERREVKDIIAFLRLIANPFDSVSLTRVINVPARGISQRTVDELILWSKSQGIPAYTAMQLVAYGPTSPEKELNKLPQPLQPRAAKAVTSFLDLLDSLIEGHQRNLPLDEIFDALLEKTGYMEYTLSQDDGEERKENIMELRTVMENNTGLDLSALLESIALISDIDNYDSKSNAVTLITLHAAKGLEFAAVFMVGMEEGLLPHIRSFDDPEQMEEERRLCYVGMTRAKKRLYLIRAFHRNTGVNRGGLTTESRFLKNIPRDLTGPGASIARAAYVSPAVGPTAVSREEAGVLPAYVAGEHVVHSHFGEGIVVSCEPDHGDQTITVAFKGAFGIKKLLLSYAPLKRLGEE